MKKYVKDFNNNPVVITAAMGLVVIFAVATHVTVASALLVMISVTLGVYIGMRIRAKKRMANK
jgi:uncharacterized membrane protein YfcA